MSKLERIGAVFIDRDGTLNEEVGYLDSLDKLEIFPQAFAAIEEINKSGMKAVVITNQSGVARGYFPEEFVTEVHVRFQEILGEKGVHIDAFYYCPHHPTAGTAHYTKQCDCRKPESGMFLQAIRDLNIDPGLSYVVGDKMNDIEAAVRIGAKGVLVRTGYGMEEEREISSLKIRPAYIADDILEAVRWIMQDRLK